MNAKNTKKAEDLMAQLQELLDKDKNSALTEAENDEEEVAEEEVSNEESENTDNSSAVDIDDSNDMATEDESTIDDNNDEVVEDDFSEEVADGIIDNLVTTVLESKIAEVSDLNAAIKNLEDIGNADKVVKILKEIVEEDNFHIGQLQVVTDSINHDADNIIRGQEEARAILNGEDIEPDTNDDFVEEDGDLGTMETIEPVAEEEEEEKEEEKNESLEKYTAKKIVESRKLNEEDYRYSDQYVSLEGWYPSKEARPNFEKFLKFYDYHTEEAEKALEELYPDGVDEDELNDMFINNFDEIKRIFNMDESKCNECGDNNMNDMNEKCVKEARFRRGKNHRLMQTNVNADEGLIGDISPTVNVTANDNTVPFLGGTVGAKNESIDDIDNTCPACGAKLNEFGACPICDDGEEDYDGHRNRHAYKSRFAEFNDDIDEADIDEGIGTALATGAALGGAAALANGAVRKIMGEDKKTKFDTKKMFLDDIDEDELNEDLEDIPVDIVEPEDLPEVGDDKEDILTQVAHGNYNPDDYIEQPNDSKAFDPIPGPTLRDI